MTVIPENWKAHDKKVKPYLWSHRLLSWSEKALGVVLLIYFFSSGFFLELESTVNHWTSQPFLRWLVYLGILAGAWIVISFPFSVAGHSVERRFNLSKQSFSSWFWDYLKGLLVGGVIGLLALGCMYLSMVWFSNLWWIAAATLLILFSVVLAQLAPVVLIPLFFKLHPMEPNNLKERLFNLCKKYSVEVKEIYHLGMGEKTEKGNAAFVGLGKTKRILIGDTLYQKFHPDEVEAVFAHELGHQRHNDMWKGIFVSAFFLYVSFGLSNLWVQNVALPTWYLTLIRPSGFLVFLVAFSIVQIPFGIFQALYSRTRENAADKFARTILGSGEKLASALERLTLQNFGLFKPNALIEFLTYSHPAPWRRIGFLRG